MAISSWGRGRSESKSRWQRALRGSYVRSDGRVVIEREFIALTNTTWWNVIVDGKKIRAFTKLSVAKTFGNQQAQ